MVLQVANIDVKKESPVGHGRITCFSIYCGPTSDFGDGKNRLWIDVLDGGEDVLLAFKPYFEDPSIMKVGVLILIVIATDFGGYIYMLAL